MVRVNIETTSTKPQLCWADVAIPHSEGVNLPLVCKYVDRDDKSKVYQAVKGRNVGDQTFIFHIKGLWNQRSVGDILPLEETDEDLKKSWTSFTMSDWISSDPFSQIPKPIYTIGGNEYHAELSSESKLISVNDAVAVFYVKFNPVFGFNTDCFMKVYSNQDAIEFSWHSYYTDPTSPSYESPFLNDLRVSCKSPFVIHWAKEKLIKEPLDPMTGSKYTKIDMNGYNIGYCPDTEMFEYSLISNIALREGQGCEITGYVMALPQGFMSAIENSGLDSGRIDNLRSFQYGNNKFGGVGEVRGIAQDINSDGKWSAFGRVPEWIAQPYAYSNPFYTFGMFGLRRIGMALTPGQTGGQEDFGSEKGGVAVSMADPKWITYYRAGLTDMNRYFHINDVGGDMVRSIFHPKWTTWNMETHDQTTGDTLGKTKYGFRPAGNGWRGYDNEHRSQNGILTWFALTGDYMVEKMIHRCIENEGAQVKNRAGAEREVGRLLLTYVKMARVTEGYYKGSILRAMKSKLATVEQQWRGRFLQNDPSRTVRVLQVIKDARSNVYDSSGNLDFAWIPYQTALMVIGMYAAAKYYKNAGDPYGDTVLDICKQLSESVARHGIFKNGNFWYVMTFVAYRTATPQITGWIPANQATPEEGLPISDEEYKDPRRATIGNSFIDWTAPAICIAKMLTEDAALKERIEDFIRYFYPDGIKSWDSSEWLACAPLN